MTSRSRFVARPATAVAVACVFVLLAAPRARAAFIESTAAIAIPALRTGFPINSGGPAFVQPPAFVDLEQDGLYEIIAVDNAGRIYIVNRDAVELGGWPKLINGVPSGPPTVGDVDLDGFPEVACANKDGVLYVFTFNGAYKFAPLVLNSPAVGAPVLAELDNSGRRAIMIATQDGKLHAITPTGSEAAGWPVTGPGAAVGGAFTFTGYDNLPRVGYMTSPGGARIFKGSGVLDASYTFNPAAALGPALPVSGARSSITINDVDHLYLGGRAGALWRFDPDTIAVGRPPLPLTAVTPDSLFDTPSLVDLDGDLVPELAIRSQVGPLLNITLRDGLAGDVLFGWPRQFPASAHGGGIVAADLGDGATPEIIFNQGGDKVTCLTALGTASWTLSGLPSVCAPAIGDLDGDGGLDMAVVTTDGRIMAYTLGLGGVGPKAVEWPTYDGTPDRNRRHHLRDRAALRPQWLPSITPLTVFTTRPMLGDITGDGIPEALWSDYTTSQTFCFTQGSGPVPGYPQTYGKGAVVDAPAVGDVTGDGVLETVQSTSLGWLVWGNRTGTINSLLLDSGKVLGPPALADLNGDGVLDVVVGSASNKLFGVNLVTKTLLWPAVSTLGPITQSPALGDITGDGQPDIVVVNNARSISAYARTGGAVLAGWPKTFTNSVLTQPILVPVAGQVGLAVSFGQARTDSVFAHLVGANGAAKAGWPRRLSGLKIFGPVAGDLNFDNVPDFVFSTDNDSIYVFAANGSTLMQNFYDSPGDLEVAAMVDVDLDQRPDIIAVSDRSEIKAVRFNGLLTRSFDRVAFFVESDQPPVFGDLGGDGTLDMGLSDLGTPVLYSFGFGSWNPAFAPWPMKGHDPKRTNAYSGLTVVGVGGPPPGLAPGAEWARAMPNPALGGRIVFSHSRPLEGRFEAAIYDLRGRLVRRIAAGEAQAGAAAPTWTWDGTDAAGSQVRAGVYFYRVTDARGALHTRVVRLQ